MKQLLLIIGLSIVIAGCSNESAEVAKDEEYVIGLRSKDRTAITKLSDVANFLYYRDYDGDGNDDILLQNSNGEPMAVVFSQEEKEKIYRYIGKDAADALKAKKEEAK